MVEQRSRQVSRINRFFKNKKGSVTIEFFFMVLILGIIFAFMADLVMLRSTLGKLDSASFSLVNVLRERTQLYGGTSSITNSDLRQFEQLAKFSLFGDKNSTQKVDVVLEFWWQDANGGDQVQTERTSANCAPYQPINQLRDLSPFSEVEGRERKVPMYQVTLCIDTRASLFKALVLNDETKTDLGMIRSSTIALSR